MTFQQSPGVIFKERDESLRAASVSVSTGATVGAFAWGPVESPVLIGSQGDLLSVFGYPNDNNFEFWFAADNFLSYSNSLYVTRATATGLKNAVAAGTSILVKNEDHYLSVVGAATSSNGVVLAKYPGAIANGLVVSIADAGSYSTWEYKDYFDAAPGTSDYVESQGGSNDEIHIIIIDEKGKFSGTAGTVLERFPFVSKAQGARASDGANNYYKTVLNDRSAFVWFNAHPTSTNWGSAAGTTFNNVTGNLPVDVALIGGADDYAVTDANLQIGWGLYADESKYDISLAFLGKASSTTAIYVDGIAQSRKDFVWFGSPNKTGAPIIGSTATEITDLIAYRELLPSTSYGILDTGVKYQYDRFNDVYRWVPLNGDIAGCHARTDQISDPWQSSGGFNRGQIKNVVRLGVNPNKTQRDALYKKGINPVVTFPGEGTVLFGDKTLLAKPSAFDRINVRRLFIILEKTVSNAAKYQLFEFNDSFTRAQFRNLVEPFLRDVQGRRGIYDFLVKCDESNNTPEVIDRNEFVGEIYVKPAKSINFISLSFVAARTGVDFKELGA